MGRCDHSDFQSTAATSTYTRPPMRSLDLQDAASSSHAHSPPPRSSSDLNDAPLSSKWRDTSTVISESHDSVSETVNLIEPAFDENVLRILCDMDCGVPLLLDRIKQSMVSCREASVFLKKRAVIEEEYGKSLQKLSRSTSELYSLNDGKAGTFVTAWQSSMRIHELMSENRLRLPNLVTLSKEVDKNRKADLATRYERALIESQGITEKSKNHNSVQIRQGGVGGKRVIGKAVAKGGLLLKGKNPGNIQRQEDDIRTRMSTASDAFRKAVTDTQAMRQEYYNFQLPRILRALKECADEIDLGTQYHLTRYAFLFESIVLSDGSTLVPPREEGFGNTLSRGLKASMRVHRQQRGLQDVHAKLRLCSGLCDTERPTTRRSHGRRFLTTLAVIIIGTSYARSSPSTSNHVINLNGTSSPDKGRPTFGVDLNEQMTRDDVDVPLILKKCCEAIERHGIESHGFKVATLKQKLDKDLDSDLDSNEWTSDINNVTSVIKMWLRELPNPLITAPLQAGFMDAA
ncbi:hypothetical protein BDZ89DRAFT_1077094, partial [Hymenopellis radicata]